MQVDSPTVNSPSFENSSPYGHLYSPKTHVANPVFKKSLSTRETSCSSKKVLQLSSKIALGDVNINIALPAVSAKVEQQHQNHVVCEQNQVSDGETDDDSVHAAPRPSRPRLVKSQRSMSLYPVKMASSVEEDENAEQSEEKLRRPRKEPAGLEKLPMAILTRGASSYMPGENDAILSPRLSKSISEALQGAVTIIRRTIGPLKLECFSGANVVNCLMRLKFAENRDEATSLAVRVYNDGVLRALQPGGFVDHVEYVYRFQDHIVEEAAARQEESPPLEQPQPTKPAAKLVPSTEKVLFSISKILGTQHEDWLNSSFGTSNAATLTALDTSSLVEDDDEDTDEEHL